MYCADVTDISVVRQPHASAATNITGWAWVLLRVDRREAGASEVR